MTRDIPILLVDDEPDARLILSSMLESDYGNIETADSAESALEKLASFKPEVIITDVKMPGEDGLWLLKKVKEFNPAIPVILLTGHGDKSMVIEGLRLGAFDYLEKPCEEEEILASVERAIELLILKSKLHDAEKVSSQLAKLSAVGELTAGIAHEINNPLAFLKDNFISLQSHLDAVKQIVYATMGILENQQKVENQTDEHWLKLKDSAAEYDYGYIMTDIDEILDDNKMGIERINKIIANLKKFVHVDEDDAMKLEDLNEVIQTVLALTKNQMADDALLTKLVELPKTICNAGEISQVLVNLIVNASHAVRDGGTVMVESEVDAENIFIRVCDTGCGIPEEVMKKIFDPFYTTKKVGEGTGLGLSISYGIIKKHGGWIHVSSDENDGTVFCIVLPINVV
jgi:signal transduction histidine kinase